MYNSVWIWLNSEYYRKGEKDLERIGNTILKLKLSSSELYLQQITDEFLNHILKWISSNFTRIINSLKIGGTG